MAVKSNLTTSFLAYSKRPQTQPITDPTTPEIYGPHIAPTDGYLSNNEKRIDRILRVRSYQDKHWKLGPLDEAFIRNLNKYIGWHDQKWRQSSDHNMQCYVAVVKSNPATIGGR